MLRLSKHKAIRAALAILLAAVVVSGGFILNNHTSVRASGLLSVGLVLRITREWQLQSIRR